MAKVTVWHHLKKACAQSPPATSLKRINHPLIWRSTATMTSCPSIKSLDDPKSILVVGALILLYMQIHSRVLTWKTCLHKKVSRLKTFYLIVWLSQLLNVSAIQLELPLTLTSTTITLLSSPYPRFLLRKPSASNLMPPQSVPSTQAGPSSPMQIVLSRTMAINRAV